jgi:raffinose/stachyose/melibiose transport system permease protein
MLTASFKQQSEWSEKPAYALNAGFYVQNYIDAWTRGHMATFFKNSLITTLVSLVFIVIFSVTVGFAVTKMEWKYKDAVAKYFSFGIMIPVAIALIPLFQIYSRMGLLNTRTCLILTYIAFGLSLSIYLVTGYLRAFPDELMEAAVIDGCGIYRLMYYIVVPLMKNAIVTVLVLQFFFKWNDLLFSMTFISDSSLKTVQTGLLYFSDEFGAKNWGAIFASVSMSVFPMLILYTALNKKVMEGMTAGAVKG